MYVRAGSSIVCFRPSRCWPRQTDQNYRTHSTHPSLGATDDNEQTRTSNGPNQLVPASTRRLEYFRLPPLNTDCVIRVLTIKPSEDKLAPIELEVEEVDLSTDHAPFVAISHVWGQRPSYNRKVLCDGKPFKVTTRVDSLLHRLRVRAATDTRCKHWNRIWIDTICIDQTENVLARREKSHQVSIMHQIFGKATEVVIDLGRAHRFSELLDEAKSDIRSLREKAFHDDYCKAILGFPGPIKLDSNELEKVRRSLEVCSRLLDKHWFARIWPLQEYALSRSSVFLMGKTLISGDLFHELTLLALQVNERGRSHLSLLFNRFRRSLAINKLPRLNNIIRYGQIEESQKLRLGESLAFGWHHDCSDRRDVVYALRSLVNYGGQPLRIDYNEPANLLAQRVSQKLLEIGDYDGLLAGARGLLGGKSSTEPSWSFRLSLPFRFIGEERHWLLSGEPNKYFAGGGKTKKETALRRVESNLNHLKARVVFVGTVKLVTERFPTVPYQRISPNSPVEHAYIFHTERTIHTRAVVISTWISHILPVLNGVLPKDDTKPLTRRSASLWRAITHGHSAIEHRTDHIPPRDRISHSLQLAEMSLKCLQVLGYKANPSATLSEDMASISAALSKRHKILNELLRKPQPFIETLHRSFDAMGDPKKRDLSRLQSKMDALDKDATSERDRLFKHVALNSYFVSEAFDTRKIRTSDQLKMLGRRLGILTNEQGDKVVSLPHSTQVGDVVALLPGISVPYVLRRHKGRDGETYKIVGMAYVDKIMRGQAVDDTTKWEEITIS